MKRLSEQSPGLVFLDYSDALIPTKHAGLMAVEGAALQGCFQGFQPVTVGEASHFTCTTGLTGVYQMTLTLLAILILRLRMGPG